MIARLTHETRDGATVVFLDGEIDLAGAPSVRRYFIDLINGGDHHLVVDLTGVTFIDSTGVGALIGATKRVRARQGSLVLVAAHLSVRQVLTIRGLDRFMPLYETLDRALEADRHNRRKRQ